MSVVPNGTRLNEASYPAVPAGLLSVAPCGANTSLGSRRVLSGRDLRHLILGKRNLHQFSVVHVLQPAITVLSGAGADHGSQGKADLQLIHALLDLVLIDRGPHVRRPMLVQLVRIGKEQYVIGGEGVIVANIGSYGYGKASALILLFYPRLLKNRQHLLAHDHDLAGGQVYRGFLQNHVLDLQLFERWQDADLVRQIGGPCPEILEIRK